MCRLSHTRHNRQRMKEMNALQRTDVLRHSQRSVAWQTTARSGPLPFEVNVIFTEQKATAAALETAESFAQGLGACVRLRAAIIVPWQLPIDQPPVSVAFFEQLLRGLVDERNTDAVERTIHVYICRDWIKTLLQVLRPNSVVVIGGRKHWWPIAESRIVRALRAKGHRVVLVDFRRQAEGRLA